MGIRPIDVYDPFEIMLWCVCDNSMAFTWFLWVLHPWGATCANYICLRQHWPILLLHTHNGALYCAFSCLVYSYASPCACCLWVLVLILSPEVAPVVTWRKCIKVHAFWAFSICKCVLSHYLWVLVWSNVVQTNIGLVHGMGLAPYLAWWTR